MTDTTKNGLCATCVNSIRCDTWGEWKCISHERRYYGENIPETCADYKKRGKDFKESPCQCEDCMKNEALVEDLEEEN